jgi:hypothetical protein
MRGYNKAGENTFPNLMAALAGHKVCAQWLPTPWPPPESVVGPTTFMNAIGQSLHSCFQFHLSPQFDTMAASEKDSFLTNQAFIWDEFSKNGYVRQK